MYCSEKSVELLLAEGQLCTTADIFARRNLKVVTKIAIIFVAVRCFLKVFPFHGFRAKLHRLDLSDGFGDGQCRAGGPRKSSMRRGNELKVNSHSQIRRADQPSSDNRSRAAASRFLVASILLRQEEVLVAGLAANRQPSCPCQKQPCTKITFRRPGNTMSGVPGRSRTWRR